MLYFCRLEGKCCTFAAWRADAVLLPLGGQMLYFCSLEGRCCTFAAWRADAVLLPSMRCINAHRPGPTPHVAQLVYGLVSVPGTSADMLKVCSQLMLQLDKL